jgi:cell pole-organizing protein PopZ
MAMTAANPKVHEPSMDEILASIRRIIADDQEGARPASAPASSRSDPPDRDDVLDLADLQPSPAQPKLELEHEDISFLESDEAIESAPPEIVPEPPPPSPAPPPAPAPPPVPDALLSRAADASVANAFSRLSSRILTSPSRTLEDVVQEMLRPMLKDWLDDNLPPMVERLVRAEIERVARGGR